MLFIIWNTQKVLRNLQIMETAQTLYLNLFGEDKIHVLKEVSITMINGVRNYLFVEKLTGII